MQRDKIKGTIYSWRKDINQDCFGQKGPVAIDHVYPRGEGGTRKKVNRFLLSKKSIALKSNKIKGVVGKRQFVIEPEIDPETGETYGVMYVRNVEAKNDDRRWLRVKPIHW